MVKRLTEMVFHYAKWPLRLSRDARIKAMTPGERWAFHELFTLAVENGSWTLSRQAVKTSYLAFRADCHGNQVRSMLVKACTCPHHGVQPSPPYPQTHQSCPHSEVICPRLPCDSLAKLLRNGGLTLYLPTTGDVTGDKRKIETITKGVEMWKTLVDRLRARLQANPMPFQERRLQALVRDYGQNRVVWALDHLMHAPGRNLDQLEHLCKGNGKPFMGPLFEEEEK